MTHGRPVLLALYYVSGNLFEVCAAFGSMKQL